MRPGCAALLALTLSLGACDSATEPVPKEPEPEFYDPLPAHPDERLSDYLLWHRWKSETITWTVLGVPPTVPLDSVRSAIRSALATWSEATTLRFTERVNEPWSDLRFAVTGGPPCSEDECPYGVAFFPGHATRPGDVLVRTSSDLNDQEWLEELMLHYAGHALGVEHQLDTGSVMAAEVRSSVEWTRLGHRDRLAIRALYGAPESVPAADPLPDLPGRIPSCLEAAPSPHAEQPDTDGDGLADVVERFITGTRTDNCDTDADDLMDLELLWGLNANAPDTDQDESVDSQEFIPSRNPLLADHRVWWFGSGSYGGHDLEGRLVRFRVLPENGAIGTVRHVWNGQYVESLLVGGYISLDRTFYLRTLDGRIYYQGKREDHEIVFRQGSDSWVATY